MGGGLHDHDAPALFFRDGNANTQADPYNSMRLVFVDETAEVDKICHSQRLGNPSQAPGPPAVTHYGDAQIRMTSPEHRRGSQDMFDPLWGTRRPTTRMRDSGPLRHRGRGACSDAAVDHPDAVGIDAEFGEFGLRCDPIPPHGGAVAGTAWVPVAILDPPLIWERTWSSYTTGHCSRWTWVHQDDHRRPRGDRS